ncbi:MAG TPA: PBP1A family penicillin-binding protein [Actinomycetota bacterium]|nr:PBP1A family penicillin-binding protein [Actinomycetota bacterium]
MTGRRLCAVSLALLLGAGACSLPPVDLDRERPLALRTTISAADGTKLARLFKQNRSLVPLERVPRSLIAAVLAAEDRRFFDHPGYDLGSIARAAVANLAAGEVVQGASTITQQYVKNAYFRRAPRTLERKARELRIALEVERTLSKRQILERYLNTVYFGDGAYGVEAAAETFFDHGVGRLTPAKSALLAAVIKSPEHYNPRNHPGTARARRNYILRRLAAPDMVGSRRARRARHSRLQVVERLPRVPTRQPYFVEAVKRELMADRLLGTTERERAAALWTGGLEVETTLDLELQRAAEEAVAGILNQPGDPEAALVAIRPSSGEIVAMVGGRDWSTSQVNLALGINGGGSGRQPGSSFKPLVAATALESGITFDELYESSGGVFTLPSGEPWVVHNAEGGAGGLIRLDEALVHSVNGVYARLILQLGADQVATQARLMGVRAKLPPYPSIALGGAEVSVLDMAASYATLANGGTAIEPTTIRSVELTGGDVLRPDRRVVEGVISPGNAYLLTQVMQEVIRRGTGVAADFGRPAAGKTGTTNDYADAWFVGYTPDLVAAVWVGHPEGAIPMTSVHGIRVSGGTFPALIWRNFMASALAGEPIRDFVLPEGELVTVLIDPDSGLLAAPWCEGEPRQMLRQLVPTAYCPPPPPEPTPSPTPEQPKDGEGKQGGGKDKGGGDEGPGGGPKPEEAPAPQESPTPKPSASPEP